MKSSPKKTAKPDRTDIQFFFLPPGTPFWHPDIGMCQLTAYLKSRGFSAGQRDLNVIFRDVCWKIKPPDGNPRQYFEAPRFWEPPLRSGAGLWNAGTPAYLLKDVLAAAETPNHDYDRLFRTEGLPYVDRARLVGFSISTPDQLLSALRFARLIRAAFPGKPICFGGAWVTASWSGLPNWPQLFDYADFMVGFRAELPLAAILSGPLTEKALLKIPNVALRSGGKVRLADLGAPLPLEKVPPPDFGGLALELYPEKALPYQMISGCEWGRCDFCCHVYSTTRHEAKSLPKIIAELKALHARYGITEFNLADMATPVAMMKQLSEAIRREKLPFTWHTLIRSNAALTRETAMRLREGGCHGLRIGLETYDQEELDRLNKGISLDIFHKNLLACASAGIEVGVFLLNYPGQTLRQLRKSFDYCTSNARLISALTPERFKLGRAMKTPTAFKGRLAKDAPLDLDSYDLPYIASGVPAAVFHRLVEDSYKLLPTRIATPL